MTDDREALGRAAYEAEVAYGHEQAGAYTSADPWEALRPEVREMFMRIGEAAETVVRERIASLMDALAANYPEDVFPPGSISIDAIGGTAMRHAYRNAARTIREEAPDGR